MGGVVPLSEHEQRQLEQIEQALYREDRRLGRLVRSSDPRVHYKRRVVQAVSGFVLGAGMVVAGVLVPFVWLAVAGFIVMLLCGMWALGSWRHMAGITLVGREGDGTRQRRRRRRNRGRGSTAKSGMMERLDERWRRRQEGDR
jgi:Na+/proline symporter